MSNPGELQKLFATQGTTNENTGIAVRFAALGDRAVGIDGSLFSRNAGLKGELSRNQKQQDDMQVHLDATQTRLTAQYQALDTTMSKMNALVELCHPAGGADAEVGVGRFRKFWKVPAFARLAMT